MTVGIDDPLIPRLEKIISRVLEGFNPLRDKIFFGLQNVYNQHKYIVYGSPVNIM